MTQHSPHPQRCETCKHCVDSVRRPGYKECKISNYLLNNNVDLIDHISQVGCASHTTPASHQLILSDLQMWRIRRMTGTLKKDVWIAWNEETDRINALLRKGEHNG